MKGKLSVMAENQLFFEYRSAESKHPDAAGLSVMEIYRVELSNNCKTLCRRTVSIMAAKYLRAITV